MMTKQQVELELRLHMANLCLAVLSKEPDILRECKERLVDKVCELIETNKSVALLKDARQYVADARNDEDPETQTKSAELLNLINLEISLSEYITPA